jgi:hypothetical protein
MAIGGTIQYSGSMLLKKEWFWLPKEYEWWLPLPGFRSKESLVILHDFKLPRLPV